MASNCKNNAAKIQLQIHTKQGEIYEKVLLVLATVGVIKISTATAAARAVFPSS